MEFACLKKKRKKKPVRKDRKEHLTTMFTRSQEVDDVRVVSQFTKDLQFSREVPVVIFGGIFWEEGQELGSLSVIPLQTQLAPPPPWGPQVHSATNRSRKLEKSEMV